MYDIIVLIYLIIVVVPFLLYLKRSEQKKYLRKLPANVLCFTTHKGKRKWQKK